MGVALELTIISAESLPRSGSRSRKRKMKKNSTYVVIIPDYNNRNKDQVTGTDIDNGYNYPLWNEKFFIDLPVYADNFRLEVRYRDCLGGVHVVGRATIWLMELKANYSHLLSYRLKGPQVFISDWRDVIINISVKVLQSSSSSLLDNKCPTCGACRASTSYSWSVPPVMGFPAGKSSC